MPRVSFNLQSEAYEALASRAVEESRPVDLQAKVLVESGLRAPATISVSYDRDIEAAAAALLAVLRPASRCAEHSEEDTEGPNEAA